MSSNGNEAPEIVIGIDLGTCNSCVAVWKDGGVQILKNDQNSITTPSCVSYSPEGVILVGQAAMDKRTTNPKNTIYDMKRVAGKTYKELGELVIRKRYWPFDIVDDEDSKMALYQLDFDGQKHLKKPERVMSEVFKELKRIADAALNSDVKHCVITVPSKFNAIQRGKIKKAAKLAGLIPLQLVNEPSAAAFAYGFVKCSNHGQNLFVFDLGGGTLDVSMAHIIGSHVDVTSMDGEANVGGRDFDKAMFDLCCQKLANIYHIEVEEDDDLKGRLLAMCEGLKIELSTEQKISIDLRSLLPQQAFSTNGEPCRSQSLTITREEFELCCMPKVLDINGVAEELLVKCGLGCKKINGIILIGLSTAMPLIQRKLKKLLPGVAFVDGLNAAEAVAYGAAIRAAQLSKNRDQHPELKKAVLSDVTGLSIGVGLSSDRFEIVYERNSPIPGSGGCSFTNGRNDKEKMVIKIFEGERKLTNGMRLIGKFVFRFNHPVGKVGTAEINLTIEVEANGVLHVTVSHITPYGTQTEHETFDYGVIKPKEVLEDALRSAEDNKQSDESEYNRRSAKENLVKAIEAVVFSAEKFKPKARRQKIEKRDRISRCRRYKKWIKEYGPTAIEMEFNLKLKEFQSEMKKPLKPKSRKKELSDPDPTSSSSSEESDCPEDFVEYNGVCKDSDDELMESEEVSDSGDENELELMVL